MVRRTDLYLSILLHRRLPHSRLLPHKSLFEPCSPSLDGRGELGVILHSRRGHQKHETAVKDRFVSLAQLCGETLTHIPQVRHQPWIPQRLQPHPLEIGVGIRKGLRLLPSDLTTRWTSSLRLVAVAVDQLTQFVLQ